MFTWLQKHGLKVTSIFNIIILIFYICNHYKKWSWNDGDAIIGAMIQLVIAGFSVMSGIILFITLFFIPNGDWGHFSEQKINLHVGCIVTIIAAGYFVLKSIFGN